jgi:phosphate transport system substrate-binding protein
VIRRLGRLLAAAVACAVLAGCAGTAVGEKLRAGFKDRSAQRTTARPNASPPQPGELVPAPPRPALQDRIARKLDGPPETSMHTLPGAQSAAQGEPPYEIDIGLPQYRPGSNMAGVIKSVGSSTLTNLLNRWSEEFERIHPRVDLNITGGGSSAAMRPLVAGTSDLAPMSRELNVREIAGFKERWGYEPLRLTVALDAVAVYVNKDNPLRSLDLRQLDALYSINPKRGGSRVLTWGELGVTGPLAGRVISLHGPRRTHGIYSVFRTMVMQEAGYRVEMQSEPVSSAIVQAPGSDDAAIAFASVFFNTRRTHQLAIAAAPGKPAVAPTAQSITDGSYPLARKLHVYVNKPPGKDLPVLVAEFLRYVCSRQGQEVLARDGGIALSQELSESECAGRL